MNYVQVKFLDTRSSIPKCYTYKNHCDVIEGDIAVVTVAGSVKFVRVEKVSKTNPGRL